MDEPSPQKPLWWSGLTIGWQRMHQTVLENMFAWMVAVSLERVAMCITHSRTSVIQLNLPVQIHRTRTVRESDCIKKMGDVLRSMLSGANLQANFWPYPFYHYVQLYNFVPHGTRPSSPYEMCGTELPNLSKLRTVGCRVHVRPTTMRYGKVAPKSRLGIFFGLFTYLESPILLRFGEFHGQNGNTYQVR